MSRHGALYFRQEPKSTGCLGRKESGRNGQSTSLHIKASLHMVFRCSLQVLQWSKPTSPEMILASRVPFLVSSFWVQCDPPLLIVPRPLARANIGAGDRHAWNYELASPESPKRKPH